MNVIRLLVLFGLSIAAVGVAGADVIAGVADPAANKLKAATMRGKRAFHRSDRNRNGVIDEAEVANAKNEIDKELNAMANLGVIGGAWHQFPKVPAAKPAKENMTEQKFIARFLEVSYGSEQTIYELRRKKAEADAEAEKRRKERLQKEWERERSPERQRERERDARKDRERERERDKQRERERERERARKRWQGK